LSSLNHTIPQRDSCWSGTRAKLSTSRRTLILERNAKTF
jgi:hypothetical protein